MLKNLYFIIVLFTICSAGSSCAESIVLQENKDAWACSCAPDANNYGVYQRLYQGSYGDCFARTYLYWDLSTLPQGIKINKVVMQIRCVSVAGTLSGKMVFYRITQDWDQKTITDRKRPQYTSQDSIVAAWPKAGQWLTIDVTKFVQFWLEHPESNFGVMGHCSGMAKSVTGAVEFYNWQVASKTYKPKLTIDYTITGVEPQKSQVPSKFQLNTYPNPFNPTMNILFSLENASWVTLKVFNIHGQLAARIVNEYLQAGEHRSKWNAAGFDSGIYFIALETEKNQVVKKVVLLK